MSLPLYAGRSWDRSDETELSGLDNNPDQDDADDNSDDGGQTEDGDAGPQDGPQFFPSSNGQQTMTVLGRETVYLDDGQAFAGSYRIRNDNLDGGSNYFWYAPGIGLVRYVLNADPNDIGQGSEVGELINFGINLRR